MDLYGGVIGVIVFLAALARMTGKKMYAAFLADFTKGLPVMIASYKNNRNTENDVIGVCNGPGSLIYGLIYISNLLENEVYLDYAVELAQLISPQQIRADRRADIESGVAGALIALLSLYQATQNATLLENAINCGRHLLTLSHFNDGVRGWKNHDDIMLAGFAHGASGIGLSLIRLYQVTQDKQFLAAGLEAFKYERTFLCKKNGNWPVLQRAAGGNIDASLFMSAWCHGAPGIGLARCGALAVCHDEDSRADLDIAIKTVMAAEPAALDYLCCGNMGRIEFLLTAGLALERPELIKTAHKQMACILRNAQSKGAFNLRLNDWQNRCFKPGFFRGLAGVGYTMLRLGRPETLPSVLLFEA
jgi:type 2 lantibiotic biosynthesis protein LanM